jgi:PAS domain-containing protein
VEPTIDLHLHWSTNRRSGAKIPGLLCQLTLMHLNRKTLVMSRPFNLENFVQAAGDAIIAAGTDGSILVWNRAAERIFGYTEAEALGRSLDLIIPAPPQSALGGISTSDAHGANPIRYRSASCARCP